MSVPTGYKKIAASCILRNKDSLLLLRRLNDPYKDHFLPLGGKVEPFENPRATAIRETFEESGLQVTDPKFCGTLVETSPTRYNWISFIYLQDIDPIAPPTSNEGVLQWIHWDDLPQYPIPDTDKAIYEYVRKNKPFAFNADFDADQKLLKMVEEMEGLTVFHAK